MATRAIRYDKLEFESARQTANVVSWTQYSPSDQEIWIPLQESVQHEITLAGDNAQDFMNKMANIRNENAQASQGYIHLMRGVYDSLFRHILEQKIEATSILDLARTNLTVMRDVAARKATKNHYGGLHYNSTGDDEFNNPLTELRQAVWEIANELNDSFQQNYTVKNTIIQGNVGQHIVGPETTDQQIAEIVERASHYLFRVQPYHIIRGGWQNEIVHQYPTIDADVMEDWMETFVETHPAYALQISRHDQMFQDNPHAQAIGHSWTSRNRSEDCWFKVEASEVKKRNTTVFPPPRTFFGNAIRDFSEMLEHISLLKADILTFLEDSKPALKAKVDAANLLGEKTNEAAQEAIVEVIQGLLDDPDTVSVGTAIVAQIAGIANLPYEVDATRFPNGHITYTYHDFTNGRDTMQYLYPYHLEGFIPLTALNITDEVQEVLYQAYRENLDSHRNNHAHRCAQLARQIAQATTRHDAEVAALMESFKEYQAQV